MKSNENTQSTYSNTRKKLGNTGEEAVSNYLLNNGFKLLAHNYYQRCGEVDIIAQKEEVIAFVEVKLRSKNYFNSSQVITPSKQRKIISTAKFFLLENKLHDVIIRFDVALVSLETGVPSITYIPNAFTGGYY